jgi:hypothetical protein
MLGCIHPSIHEGKEEKDNSSESLVLFLETVKEFNKMFHSILNGTNEKKGAHVANSAFFLP